MGEYISIMNKKIAIYLGVVLMLFSSLSAKEITTNQDAVLATGMEMSNIRKMLEVYISIGNNITYRNPTEVLQKRIAGYENLLVTLESNFQNNTILTSVQQSKKAWKPVKKALVTALDKNVNKEEMKKTAVFIHGNIRAMIAELSFMKQYFLTKLTSKDKESLNASIEIAASARRLSAHYMMRMWKLDDTTIQEHWIKGLKIYADSLQVLEQSFFKNDMKFHKLLKECIKYHKYLTRMGKKERFSPALVTKKTTIVFENANKMTHIILSNK